MIYDRIKKAEAEFPKHFTNWEDRDYGILFYNEADRDSYDSNHAVLYPEQVHDLNSVLQDITLFYKDKKITPNIYHPFVDGYFENNKDCFEKNGYEIHTFDKYNIMILSADNAIISSNELDIRHLNQWDERISTDIFLPNGEAYEVEVARNSMHNSGNYLFVGYLHDVAVVTLYLHTTEYGCTRFDYINTAKSYRGKGYAREILSYVVNFCRKNKLPDCFQWPAHESSRKMCYEAGFRPLFELPNGAATYVGTM